MGQLTVGLLNNHDVSGTLAHLEELWEETAQAGCAGYSAEAELKRWAWLTATPTPRKTLVIAYANHRYFKCRGPVLDLEDEVFYA